MFAIFFSGVGGMEIVAMDMKQRDSYIARLLSFQGVDFDIMEVPLSETFETIYNGSVKFVSLVWFVLKFLNKN